MISHTHKFIFVHIFKAGGTSVENSLYDFFGSDKVYGKKLVDNIHRCPDERVCDLSELGCEIKWLTGWTHTSHIISRVFRDFLKAKGHVDIWKNYFKFAFVRNPWDLLVSLYFHYVRINCMHLTFEEFLGQTLAIKDPFSRGDNKYDLHYNSLTNMDWVADENGNQLVDFIGRFENLQEDFNTICDKIGIPRQELPHKNKTNHKHYTEYYDDETRDLVEEKYAKDLEYFGYKFGE